MRSCLEHYRVFTGPIVACILSGNGIVTNHSHVIYHNTVSSFPEVFLTFHFHELRTVTFIYLNCQSRASWVRAAGLWSLSSGNHSTTGKLKDIEK